jgi:hypothetical protein
MSTRPEVRVYMGADMKEWLTEYAARKGVPVSEVVVAELVQARRFDEFTRAHEQATSWAEAVQGARG